ncbi:MAG: Holliday junction branch migration protein RuvA [Planctomycetota bacterium]
MITRIKGQLTSVRDDDATLSVGNFDYQVLIPDFVRRQLQGRLQAEISLHTVYYLEGNPTQGKLTPRMVGFLSEVEREFFEMFCSVDGVGVRKALRAMVRPVQEVATLIADQNAKGLAALPGIGPSTAERIIAKLRRKMCKFALLAQRETASAESPGHDVVEEAFQMLAQLGHSEAEARQLLDETLATKKTFKDVDALMHAIYETRNRPGSSDPSR